MQSLGERIVVVGTSCCGKTVFARQLAQRLGSPCVELDELYWAPSWTPKPDGEFQGLVEAAASGPRWVIEGNYGRVRDTLWSRATTIVWLNYGFPTVLFRALRRTFKRVFTREKLWHENRESMVRSFLSRDSILIWVVTTFQHRRREFEAIRAGGKYPHLSWLEFRRPADVGALLRSITNAC